MSDYLILQLALLDQNIGLLRQIHRLGFVDKKRELLPVINALRSQTHAIAITLALTGGEQDE